MGRRVCHVSARHPRRRGVPAGDVDVGDGRRGRRRADGGRHRRQYVSTHPPPPHLHSASGFDDDQLLAYQILTTTAVKHTVVCLRLHTDRQGDKHSLFYIRRHLSSDCLLVTPFDKMSVPPPMCAFKITLPCPIVAVAYASDDDCMAALLVDSRVAIFNYAAGNKVICH